MTRLTRSLSLCDHTCNTVSISRKCRPIRNDATIHERQSFPYKRHVSARPPENRQTLTLPRLLRRRQHANREAKNEIRGDSHLTGQKFLPPEEPGQDAQTAKRNQSEESVDRAISRRKVSIR